MTDLPRAYISLLVDFFQCGGSGRLDMHGRIIAGTPPRVMQPHDANGLSRLVAAGLIAGEDGKLFLTEPGRTLAMKTADGTISVVKEASA